MKEACYDDVIARFAPLDKMCFLSILYVQLLRCLKDSHITHHWTKDKQTVLVVSLMSLRPPWWPPAECSNVSMSCEYCYLQNVFLFLCHCCILSEIKLTTTTIGQWTIHQELPRPSGSHSSIQHVYCCINEPSIRNSPGPADLTPQYNMCTAVSMNPVARAC